MKTNNLLKKITAIGTIGLLASAPLAFADNHNNTAITGEVENTQDIEAGLNNLSVNIKTSEKISSNVADETISKIEELKNSLENSQTQSNINIEARNGQVTINVDGEISSQQRDILNSIEQDIQELAQRNENAQIQIESEVEIEENASQKNENSNNSRAEEAKENRILSNSVGVEMRFEQLKARLDARVQNANLIIDRIDENASEQDLEKLQNITSQFENFQNELDNSTAPIKASEFVAIKKEIIDLSNEFKATASPYITNNIRSELEAEINANIVSEKEESNERIQDLRKKLNSKIISQNFGNVSGVDVETLSQQYVNGEITLGEFQSQIKTQISSMNKEQRAQINSEISQNRNSIAIDAKTKAQEIREEAINNRREIVNNIRDNLPIGIGENRNGSDTKSDDREVSSNTSVSTSSNDEGVTIRAESSGSFE